MSAQFSRPASLSCALRAAGQSLARFQFGPEQSVFVGDLLRTSVFGRQPPDLRGRSVLIATADSFTAALALIELDGQARRIVLCPPDFSIRDLSYVVQAADVDALITDQYLVRYEKSTPESFAACPPILAPSARMRKPAYETEWILLTTGTTGRPKLVIHTLATLCGAIKPANTLQAATVWSTFYDIRRYGGLQIFLRAIFSGASLLLPDAHEPMPEFFRRAASEGITHISGTPSHWRKALLSPEATLIAPSYVRLSGEIADQAILNYLHAVYPKATIAHAFASTEAGVACEVNDGIAGLPSELFNEARDPAMKVVDGSLRICSSRTALCYLGSPETVLHDAEGFVDTGDLLEPRGGRYYFTGRRDGVVNVGGLKVHPEEVEAVINRFPDVQMSLVRSKKSAITGALVTAEVVLRGDTGCDDHRSTMLPQEILHFCQEWLPSHKVPAMIRIVSSLPMTTSGKLSRRDA
jgi:acyl-coenzyme A synthetase/AMP-(fatty) acid ligase